MEQLIFILFILFSIGTSLAERRKRAQRLQEEEARRRRQAVPEGAAPEERPVRRREVRPVRPPTRASRPGAERGQPTRGQTSAPAAPRSRPAAPPPEPAEESEAGWPFGPEALEMPLPESRPLTPAQMLTLAGLEAERRALAAERQALATERAALEAARQAQEETARQRRLPDAQSLERAVQRVAAWRRLATARGLLPSGDEWPLDPATARRAVVYAEILGRPRCERLHEVGRSR